MPRLMWLTVSCVAVLFAFAGCFGPVPDPAVDPAPLFSGIVVPVSHGCGNFSLYAPAADGLFYLVVNIPNRRRTLTAAGETFVIGRDEGFQVFVEQWTEPPVHYCNCYSNGAELVARWLATDGTGEAALVAAEDGDLYHVQVQLFGITLKLQNSSRRTEIESIKWERVTVGGYAG